MYYVNTLPDDVSKGSPHKVEKGVILSKIPYTQEYHHHATAIASSVLRNMDWPSIEWLMDNMDDNGCIWHDFKLPFYEFETPWVGGLAQGLTISALVKAYEKYKVQDYLEGAKKAYNGLKLCCFKDGWIYEYPGVPSILNGNIYALFGLYDLLPYHSEVKNTLNSCVHNLLVSIQKFDTGYWSRYDLITGIPATKFYHEVHIEQLAVLGRLSSLPNFTYISEIFKGYNKEKINHILSKTERFKSLLKKHGPVELYRINKRRKAWK